MQIEKTETFVENDIWVDGTKIGTVELCPERKEISRLIIFEPYQNKGYGTQVVQELVARSGWYEGGFFHNDNGDTWKATDREVKAWIPLPEPYKEKVREKE